MKAGTVAFGLTALVLGVLVVVGASRVSTRLGATVVWLQAWGLGLIAAAAISVGLWYRAARRVRARMADLEKLYAYTVRLASLSDTDEIIGVSLADSGAMVSATHTELRLPDELGGIRCSLEPGGEMTREFGPATALEDEVAGTRRTMCVRPDRSDRSGHPLPALVAVPVFLDEQGVAVLVVGDDRPDGFGAEDVRLLEAVAANLGTALTSSHRLDQLRLEVAARQHQALHDSLTGLGNRVMFGNRVGVALEERGRDERVGVMLMDLDGFKDINDTLGHHTGDAVLQEVAARILDRLGLERSAARLGGDEFAFVIPEAEGPDQIMGIARAVRDAVSQPVTVEGVALEVSASVGVAVAPEHGTDPSTLLRRADVAMYEAKTNRRGVVAYDRDIDQHAKRRLTLTNELRAALDTGDLAVWYQPVARMGTGEVVGMEALLRWRHPEYGSISPSEFIPVAEQSGLIEPITWWVLDTSLKDLAAWRRDGFELTMAVNFSARSLTGPDVAERLGRLLMATGIPPADLTLEITESSMMADPEGAQRALEQLDRLGVKIAIDDFGTGYSSLSRLKRLPVHTVKIDRSFVMTMHQHEGDEAIVRATIELARNMGHEVIAEGVERQDAWDRLVVLGCDLVQGHLLAPAMPLEMCRAWLNGRQSPRMATISPLRARLA
ncbi:MAG TPA: GGDEF domain-containing protein [Acidimicrobiales bacterium]|nr:GGDEF domain-containing protein [Acidimicrobiales bacterium]